MAEYILDVLTKTDKLDWAFPFQRTGAFPLDRSSVFSSLADARLYASGAGDERGLGGSSYVGQPISVYDATSSSVTLYTIQPDRSLKEVGSAPVGDNLSVELADGKIQVKGFGKGYYKYVPKTETENAKYEFVDGEFIEGLEPRVVNTENGLEIAWYQPSNEEFYTKTEVQTLISTAIANADHLKRQIVASKDEIDLTAENADQYIYMVPTGLQHEDDKYDEYIVINGALEKVGDWEVDLSNYYTKTETDTKIADAVSAATGGESAASVLIALNAYKTSNDARVKAVEDDVAALKEVQAEKNVINSVSSEFNISDTRELSINEIPIAKIANLQDSLDGHNTRITALENALNGEDEAPGLIAKVASLEEITNDLGTNYVTIADFKTVVGDIEAMKTDNRNLLTDINNIQDILTWKDIPQE